MIKKHSRNKLRVSRKNRYKKHLRGDAQRPRMTVFKSLKYLYAQVIDDSEKVTIVGIGTQSKQFSDTTDRGGKSKEKAKILGKLVAEECIKKGIKTVKFDRAGYKYHGKIKEFADAAREAGLDF